MSLKKVAGNHSNHSSYMCTIFILASIIVFFNYLIIKKLKKNYFHSYNNRNHATIAQGREEGQAGLVVVGCDVTVNSNIIGWEACDLAVHRDFSTHHYILA